MGQQTTKQPLPAAFLDSELFHDHAYASDELQDGYKHQPAWQQATLAYFEISENLKTG